MKCPICTTVNLVMSERQGVEIDYCPECRGVWLDRGELDKIIERSASQETTAIPMGQSAPSPSYPSQQDNYGHGREHGNRHGYEDGYKPYRKKSFLAELFD